MKTKVLVFLEFLGLSLAGILFFALVCAVLALVLIKNFPAPTFNGLVFSPRQ